MATPLGHGLAGAIICLGCRRVGWQAPSMAAAVIVANLPDADFLPGILVGWPSRYHHGASHSIVAAMICALAIGIWSAAGKHHPTPARAGILLGVCYLSHVIIDYFTVDTGTAVGIPVFWPFSHDLFIAPHPIFGDVKRDNFFDLAILRHDLWNLVIESAVFLPLFLLLHHAARRKP
ncbi:MAG: metal-dependent hydrolase [Acidobacteria bacterium]|nr:metal-dependent hydrolase [Acidobacteriota bacterium]